MANRVKELRKRAGLSQVELARRARLAAPNLSEIENSKRVAWPLARMRLARALKCQEAELFPEEGSHGAG